MFLQSIPSMGLQNPFEMIDKYQIRRIGDYPYDFQEEFTSALATGSVNGTSCEPGVGTRTVTDAETCLSILPNVGSSLANQTGVTFGGSNNRCSYATGYGWMDFPVGFNAAAHANLGRIVVMYDSNGRAAWGFLGGGGTAESLGSEIITGFTNNAYETLTTSGANITSAINSDAANATAYQSVSFSQNILIKVSINTFTLNSGTKPIFVMWSSSNLLGTSSVNNIPTSNMASGVTVYAVSNSTVGYCGFRNEVSIGNWSASGITLKQVTAPSSTGCYIYPTLAAAVAGNTAASGWNKPAAFNMNSATYTFNIYQPTSGGKLFFMGGKATAAAGDPGEWVTTATTRTAGQIIAFRFNAADATKIITVGASNAKTGTVVGNGLKIDTDLLKPLDGATTGPAVFVPLDGVDYTLVCILRAAGAQFFIKTGTGVFKRIWSYVTDNTATLYVAITGHTLAGTVDFIRIPKTRWLPTPLLSDSFAAADATSNNNRLSDGAGHAETTGLGSGGAGVACFVVAGTSVIASNKATFSALSSSIGIAVWETNNANVTIRGALTRSAGDVGIVLRYVDADNYVRAIHNGTNAQLIKRVAGSEVTSINTAIAYSTGAEIAVRLDGTKFSLWYNNTLAGSLDTEITDSAIQSSGKCGIYTSDTGATFDNLTVYATGTGNEFAVLDRLIGS